MNSYNYKNDVKQYLHSENLMTTAYVLKSSAEVVTHGTGNKACESSDIQHGAGEILTLLGCDTVYVHLVPMFWNSVSLSSSRATYPP